MNHFVTSIVDIIPALIGILISGILLVYTALNKFETNQSKIIILSFIVMSSGFVLQMFSYFIFENKLAVTLIGIFCANYALKELANRKEKKEISILFVNAIESQIRALGFMNFYLNFNSTNLNKDIEYFKIYKSRLDNNKLYEKGLEKIGIYNQLETNILSQYTIMLNECLSYTNRLFSNFESNSNSNSIKNQDIYLIVRLSIIQSVLYGLLAIYILRIRYLKEDITIQKNTFMQDYFETIEQIKSYILMGQKTGKIQKQLGVSLFAQLKDIKNKFQLINSNLFDFSKKETQDLYIAIMTTNKNKHILQYESIISFGTSEDEAINNCKNSFTEGCKNNSFVISDEQQINILIEQCDIECNLIYLS